MRFIKLLVVASWLVPMLGLVGCETIARGLAGPGRLSGSAPAPADPQAIAADDARVLPSCADTGGCLRVITFNTKHRDVPVQLAAVAKRLQSDCPQSPDFILCQEVVFDRPKSKGQDNTAAALAERLGAGWQCRAIAREGGPEGVAILSPHPFEHFEHLHLKTRDAWHKAGFPRVSVMGEFQLPQVGRVRVVNVHLAHRHSAHDIRREQLRETLEWMAARQLEVPADAIILGGDFNIEPGWEEWFVLKDTSANGGLEFHDFNSTAPCSGKVGRPFQRVDYVYVAAPDRAVTGAGEAILWPHGIPTVDGASRFHPSDHQPLLHVFEIGATNAPG